MNDAPSPADRPDEDAERLVSRIVERAALPSDYDAFATLARQGAGRWQQLLDALRDDDALHLALQESLAPAERVALPVAPPAPRGGLRPWTGWLAAAALALAWLSADLTRTEPGPSGWSLPPDDAPLSYLGPADAVLAELPARLVSTSPVAGGSGYDVLYVQPVLRRARVNQVVGLGSDEHGRPAPVPVDPAVLARRENL
jgi:hypothetical protein